MRADSTNENLRSVYAENLSKLEERYGPLLSVRTRIKSEIDKLCRERKYCYEGNEFYKLQGRFEHYERESNFIKHIKNTCRGYVMATGDEDIKNAIADYYDLQNYAKLIISDIKNGMKDPEKRTPIDPVQLAKAKDYFGLSYA